MAKIFTSLTPELLKFIKEQKLFFVATADSNSRINLSPKGMDSFRIIDNNTALWLNMTGSGNETAAHVLADGRMTIMFCAFEGKPIILKLYGKA
ncbi:MAG: pyridoxamine 5'-phosphate oxidase family protein, partial [Gammaproteobacteria bacterium]|nr:pyridoxamine 5'-phosphate oxidase family protein [Gammaproteobacteria bacterium]